MLLSCPNSAVSCKEIYVRLSELSKLQQRAPIGSCSKLRLRAGRARDSRGNRSDRGTTHTHTHTHTLTRRPGAARADVPSCVSGGLSSGSSPAPMETRQQGESAPVNAGKQLFILHARDFKISLCARACVRAFVLFADLIMSWMKAERTAHDTALKNK